MQALAASPEVIEDREEEKEVEMEESRRHEPESPRVYTIDEFERWWARSEELNSILRRLPHDVVAAAAMENRRAQLLERFEDLETPELDEEFVDEEMAGALQSWIRDSETLIHYIIYTRDVTRESTPDARTANDPVEAGVPAGSAKPPAPIRPALNVIRTLDDAPGVSDEWHWPWIDGWDDPDKRQQILNPKKKKGKKMSIKRAATMTALGAGAVYVFSRYLDE